MRGLRYCAATIILISIILLASCNLDNHDSVAEKENITVITSFYTMYEFTKQIAQDQVDVQMLIPPHVTPHDWDPAPKDIRAVQDADLFVYSSEHFETWVPNIDKSLNNSKTRFVHASEGISLLHGDETDGHHEHNHDHAIDPHVWLSPVLAQKQVENIAKALIEIDPNNEPFYAEHRDQYIEKLQKLDEEYRETLRRVTKKEFITQHSAFGYLANEYGLTEIPIAGLSPSLEPSASQLAELKKIAHDHEITTIFFEDLSNPKTAQTLANEIGAEVDVLSSLEGLTKEQQDKERTYIDIMRLNLKALEKSLK